MVFSSSPLPDSSLEGCKIVPSAESDLEEVLAIERASFPHPWSKYAFRQELRGRYSCMFCGKVPGEEGEKVVGYICLWLIRDEAHITNLAVHPAFRRRGLAGKMLDFAVGFVVERGALTITLEVRRSNDGAIKMYESRGFRRAGIRKGYYFEDKEDAVVMVLDFGDRSGK